MYNRTDASSFISTQTNKTMNRTNVRSYVPTIFCTWNTLLLGACSLITCGFIQS